MRTTWETRDAAKLLGTNARRLMGWTEKGLMTPTVAGGGKGSRRLYTLVDLVEGVVLMAVQDVVGERNTITRGSLSVLRGQLEQGRVIDQLKTGEILSADENVLFIMLGAKDATPGSPRTWPFVIFGGVDEWRDWVKSTTANGLSVLTLPLQKPLTELLKRLREEEEETA